jgi:hypothetical protein
MVRKSQAGHHLREARRIKRYFHEIFVEELGESQNFRALPALPAVATPAPGK